jgi:integrase
MKINFTDRRIRDLKAPRSGRLQISDTNTKGLRLRITSAGTRTWAVSGRIKDGKTIWYTLGEFPAVSVDEARLRAGKAREQLRQGIDPTIEAQTRQSKAITLRQAVLLHIEASGIRESTAKNYLRALRLDLTDVADTTLLSVKASTLAKKLKELGGAPAKAKLVADVFNAAWKRAASAYPEGFSETINPMLAARSIVHIATPESRTHHIPRDRLSAWLQASLNQKPVMRDYLQFLLLTGLRRREASELRWDMVTLEKGKTTLTFSSSEVKSNRRFILPVGRSAEGILLQRSRCRDGIYVFPSPTRNGLPIQEPAKAAAACAKAAGVHCPPHGLRRTFSTVAQLEGVPASTVSQLLNHSAGSSLATNTYNADLAETLRPAMQQIEDSILRYAANNNVIPITPEVLAQ